MTIERLRSMFQQILVGERGATELADGIAWVICVGSGYMKGRIFVGAYDRGKSIDSSWIEPYQFERCASELLKDVESHQRRSVMEALKGDGSD